MKTIFSTLTAMLLLSSLSVMAQPTQTSDPVSGNGNTCINVGTTGIPLDACPAGSNNFQSDFRNGVYNRGNNANHFGANAIWRFGTVGNIGGTRINAEITINSLYNAVLNNSATTGEKIEDDAAVDQANNSTTGFFSPRIAPDQSLHKTDRQGYVQFTITFFNGSLGDGYTTTFPITNLNYVHYDIDGSYKSGGATNAAWFRETGAALQDAITANKFVVTVASGTELKAYNYTDNSGSTLWSGFAGTVFERDGVSRCAQTAVSYRYTAGRSSVAFRMGYSFKAGTTGGYNYGNGARQYGATFGCYAFPQAITLPVRLLDFSGTFKNNVTTLNWVTDNELNFDHFDIERSINGSEFMYVGNRSSNSSTSARQTYQYTEDIGALTSSVFYYRLKMVDHDGTSKYSNVIVIRKETKSITGIAINPVPVRNGVASLRFTSAGTGLVNMRIMDLSGKTLLQQQSKVFGGNNSISLNNLDRLQPGIYMLQMDNGGEVNAVKFTVTR